MCFQICQIKMSDLFKKLSNCLILTFNPFPDKRLNRNIAPGSV